MDLVPDRHQKKRHRYRELYIQVVLANEIHPVQRHLADYCLKVNDAFGICSWALLGWPVISTAEENTWRAATGREKIITGHLVVCQKLSLK